MEWEKDLGSLSDEALRTMASAMRREAGQGHRQAYGHAHELEKEVRRRNLAQSPTLVTLAAADHTLAVLPEPARRSRWRFWRRA